MQSLSHEWTLWALHDIPRQISVPRVQITEMKSSHPVWTFSASTLRTWFLRQHRVLAHEFELELAVRNSWGAQQTWRHCESAVSAGCHDTLSEKATRPELLTLRGTGL